MKLKPAACVALTSVAVWLAMLACGGPFVPAPDTAATVNAISTSVQQTLAARGTAAPASPFPFTPTAFPTAIPPLATLVPTIGVTPTPWLAQPPTGHIVFVCFIDGFDNLCLMNADGTNQQRLTTTQATDFYPSLSGDGQTIVFSSRRDNNFEIYALNIADALQGVDGTQPRRLTQNLGSNFGPALSPDGTRIVFASVQPEGQHIWLMNSDGTNPIQLTNRGGDVDPEWSPDGTQIAFASNRSGTTELYLMNADGSNVRQVTFELNIGGRSDWSADGQQLTFYAGPAGARNIFIINADGSNLRQLTDSGDNRGPTFSPDGGWIAFTGFRDGDNEIYLIRPDGSQLTQLTFNTRPDWQPRWGP